MRFSLQSIKCSEGPPSLRLLPNPVRCLNCAQRFDYRSLCSSRKLGGAQSSPNFWERIILRKFLCKSLKVGHLSDNFFLFCWLESSFLWAVSRSKISHLGMKTWKFDTWNSDVWRHVKTCFARVRSRVDAIDGKKLIKVFIVAGRSRLKSLRFDFSGHWHSSNFWKTLCAHLEYFVTGIKCFFHKPH